MRPGLIGVGALLLALGGATLAGALTTPTGGGASSTDRIVVELPFGSTQRGFGWGLNGSGTTLAIAWHSTGPVRATVSEPGACGTDPNQCPLGTILVQWSPNSSGAFASAAPAQFPILLTFQNAGGGSERVDVTLTTSQGHIAPIAMWATVSFLMGGVVLAAIGGLSIFLGLFLRGGVFQPSRSDDPAPATDPRTAR